MQESPLLEVRQLKKHFPIKGGLLGRTVERVHAVDGVSLTLRRGETLGLVGESGCGKSTLGRTILRLYEPTSGQLSFAGVDLLGLSPKQLRHQRRDMQIIFQDPFSSLNPRMTVGHVLAEPFLIHRIGTRQELDGRIRTLLETVGLPAEAADRYPHEFSGGQRQRIGIARAIALNPKLIVADEPVSALDVSIQSQILNLLVDLRKNLGLSYLFVAHDLAVIEHISDQVAVMYLGKIVEYTSGDELYAKPSHPYTRALISAIPVPSLDVKKARQVLKGDVPSPINPPSGCHFHPRCPLATKRCSVEAPELRDIGTAKKQHLVSCHYAQ
ncbi:MAG: dipeptide ABC transporter ATP-binding protein [Proteobacteria bacterium]|nr:dipeptide ABC transporter ATP-binding protein [Pseudomonadota bacterium]